MTPDTPFDPISASIGAAAGGFISWLGHRIKVTVEVKGDGVK